jgi:hypothetical protein
MVDNIIVTNTINAINTSTHSQDEINSVNYTLGLIKAPYDRSVIDYMIRDEPLVNNTSSSDNFEPYLSYEHITGIDISSYYNYYFSLKETSHVFQYKLTYIMGSIKLDTDGTITCTIFED